MGKPSGVKSRPALAAAIVVVLLAGIAVAVVQPGDLGGDGELDAVGPTTTTTIPAGAPAPAPEGTEAPAPTDAPGTTEAPGTTPADGGVDGAEGGDGPTTTVPAPAPGVPTPTTTAPAPTATAPAPGSDPTGESQPRPTLAHTGGSDALAPLAAVLLLAGAAGRKALRSRRVEPTT